MSKNQPCIVTITDGISPTSMPYNEFVLYRLNHFPKEKQVLIQVFERGIKGNITIPSDVEYYSLGMSMSSIWKIIHQLENKYEIKAYHIHEGKSVLLFSIATLLKYRNKTIYTLHSTYRNYPFHNKLFCLCASLIARDVVCVSKTSLKYYPRVIKRFRGKHISYIQNGVDTERIDSVSNSITIKARPFNLIYVARLVELKRHSILFDALKQLPFIKLQLVGVGPLEQELRQKAKEYGIDRQVEFLGLRAREDVYRLLKESDLYVSSSSYEGLPIGVLEAMACGTPCLLSDIEQHAEIAEKCPTLLLCPDSINQWVMAIRSLMSLSAEEVGLIKDGNRQAAIKYFSLSAMHNHYNKLYYR